MRGGWDTARFPGPLDACGQVAIGPGSLHTRAGQISPMGVEAVKETHYGHLTAEEAERAAADGYTVVLPVGAIEQHGPHLPIDTDAYLALRAASEGVVEAREKYNARVLCLPVMPYGNSFAHLGFPGRISLGFETFISVICDILDELIRQGFRRFVLLNGNGGNESGLTIAAQKVTENWVRRGIRVFIYRARAASVAGPSMPEGFAEKIGAMLPGNKDEIHAGARETSWLLAGREGLVRVDRLVKPVKRSVSWDNKTLADVSDTGATGDPTQASREVGELLWETKRTGLAKMFAEISAGEPERQAGETP